ncbi:uncharacterized protein (TIGR00369 family) [Tamaricihabitans halophyticus]|uniref:Medium/long-chain acyl-CoA thioesterase YigI n=1 Tax=Tamaricihabitans halophyticus TaxID=1262583 RepID=A0A4V2SV02_9PSEU|nr:PaaI family thioesterase [Tamaricihabitans halophyticus]TCP56586.1 uncharacterized protein (TIGR00369 family) [Tamaricihabitans halophyticus]
MAEVTSVELSLADARQVLAAQPFSVLLGTRLTAFSASEVVLEIDIRAELHQQNGFVHGGVLSYLADNALTFAGGAALGPAVLTRGFSVDYLRPATGTLLRAAGQVVTATRGQAAARCEIYALSDDADAPATLCALAQGTVRAVREGG